jgi:DNA-directed RNA polymerase subunit RPC12/RpoP
MVMVMSKEIAELALKLYDLGFNIVPVSKSKKPLTSWSSVKRIDRDELLKLLPKATGIAIVGGSENPWKAANTILVVVDVDKPNILEKLQTLREILSKTVSWRTGPRCLNCLNKDLEVIEEGKRFRCSKCGKEFTIEEAPRGLGALITIDYSTYEKFFRGSIKLEPIEFQINNYQLIPPSLHKTGVRYEWIKPFNFNDPSLGIYATTEAEVEAILKELGILKEEATEVEKVSKKLRELSDSDILRIKDLLKPAYEPGARQFIWLYLSGWSAKAGVAPTSVAKILKILYEETGDTDPIKTRASAIVYSYKKAGIDLTPYAEQLKQVLGIDNIYGLEREISEKEVKGKTGLQEILEQSLGEEKALEVIRQIEDIFGAASPFKDSVFEILDYEKQLYAVANLRKLVVVRAKRDSDRIIYKERVFIGAPTEVTVYINPIGGITKYQVKWETTTRPKPLIIGPALIEEIVDRLKVEGLVTNRRLAEDVLTAIIEGFIRKRKAEIRNEIDATGFFMTDGKLIASSYRVEEPSKEELREALVLLNELAKWYAHAVERFAAIVKWGVIAPFIYIYKQRGKWIKWLYLYGASGTGKTTLAEIILSIWGLGTEHMKTGANIDTVARLGQVLSTSTFPVVINEPGNALSKEDIIEMIKNAIEKTVSRGKFYKGSYIEIPALAPLIFTSNKYVPQDDALLRRLIVITFSYGERLAPERINEFNTKVKPRLVQLQAIGKFVASYVMQNSLEDDYEKLVEKILEQAYRVADLEIPEWIYMTYAEEFDIYEHTKEVIRSFFLEKINEAYQRFMKSISMATVEERVRAVLVEKVLPWLLLKPVENNENEKILITSSILPELWKHVGESWDLKGLAELLGWSYKNVKIGNRVLKTIVVDLKTFINFLEGNT